MTQLRVSRARTAWGLVQDVKRRIARWPEAANMGTFCTSWRPDSYDGDDVTPTRITTNAPTCGSAGCFAGHIAFAAGVLFGNDNKARDLLGYDVDYHTVGKGKEYVFNAGEGDRCDTTRPGTNAHARAVVARINRFARINEKVLRARKLEVRDGVLVARE